MNRMMAIVLLLITFVATTGNSEEPVANASFGEQDRLYATFLSACETVLAHHFRPPTRQAMLLETIRRLDAKSAHGLVRQISNLSSDDSYRRFFRRYDWSRCKQEQESSARFRIRFAQTCVGGIEGGARFISSSETRVAKQLRDNQYVGIGIAIAKKDGFPYMSKVLPRGPAWKAGAKDGDQIVSVDGTATVGRGLGEVIKLLRGARGTDVAVGIRRGDPEIKTLELVRDVVPFDTITGSRMKPDGTWVFRVAKDVPVAYLKLVSIRGSTVPELRTAMRRATQEGCRAAVLDLSAVQGGEMRHAALLADACLPECPLGSLQDARGMHPYRSRAGDVFAGMPLAVVVGTSTGGQAQWLAAAFQDQKRAILVGQSSRGSGYVRNVVSLSSGDGDLDLITGILARADGTPLVAPRSGSPIPRVAPLRGSDPRRPKTQRFRVTPSLTVGENKAKETAIDRLRQQLKQDAE